MSEVELLRPQVPDDLSTIVKPEELVDIVEMTPLTLQDRRIYNILIGNAWNNIFTQKRHEISRAELTRYTDSNNHDLAASLRRLMSAMASSTHPCRVTRASLRWKAGMPVPSRPPTCPRRQACWSATQASFRWKNYWTSRLVSRRRRLNSSACSNRNFRSAALISARAGW